MNHLLVWFLSGLVAHMLHVCIYGSALDLDRRLGQAVILVAGGPVVILACLYRLVEFAWRKSTRSLPPGTRP